MKKCLALLACLMISNVLPAQDQTMNRMVFDSVAKKNILLGYCSREGLMDTLFSSYFKMEYANYHPDTAILSHLKKITGNTRVTIVMGTWCSDSQEQVPRFFRICDALGHSLPPPVFICVNKNKTAGELPVDQLAILKVPTFIIYRDQKEIGRIVETPSRSLEKDLLDILTVNE
jgi:hypothetical protein